MNYVWFILMLAALIVAAVLGRGEALTQGAIEGASTAVEISIGLVGVMALWLGMMRIAEKAGMVQFLARLMAPLLRRIFPDLPPDHPALASITLSLAANALGLNNAATPLGIKAMEDLQQANGEKETASNSMVTYLAIITSGVQFIPATAIAVLVASGSRQPTVIIGTTLLATVAGTIAGVIAARLLERFYPQRKEPAAMEPGS